jgi:hypothetical protein
MKFSSNQSVPSNSKGADRTRGLCRAVRQQIDVKIRHWVIERSSSPYSNPLPIVPKPFA